MEVVKKLKIHGKWIICKIKRSKSKRGFSSILSYGHLRIVCGEFYSESKIVSTLESLYSIKKIEKVFSDDLINDEYVYLLGEKRRIVVLSEGQNATSMTDLIFRNRKDIEKYLDKFRIEVFTERVRRYEQIMTEKNRISTFLDDETTEALKEEAKKQGRSVSNLIGYIIKKYLEEQRDE